MSDRVHRHFRESIAIKESSISLAPIITEAGHLMARCLEQGGKILGCGNGGSAADAQHFAAELLGRFEMERGGLPAVALTTDTSALTAISNDYGFEDVFAKQVTALGARGDVLLGISTSGKSENVLRAIRAAQAKGMRIVALTGRDGGSIAHALDESDIEIRVPADRTCRIQEVHGLTIHCLCDLIDAELFGAP